MKILKAAKIAPLMLRDKGFENWCDVICDVRSRGSSGDGLLVYLFISAIIVRCDLAVIMVCTGLN